MILYFTGTGNSAYVAERIGREANDEVINLFERLREKDFTEIHSERPWVIVTPTYAWRIPRILQEWMKKTKLSGSRDIYFVMTCGTNIGNAGKYLKSLCREKRLRYFGCLEVVMPENYIALFKTPTEEEALNIIRRAEKSIEKAAAKIKNGEKFPRISASAADKLSSGIINDLFYPLFVHARKFYTTDSCISCGKCREVCPLQNIRMNNGRPVWGKDCTHCMACICRCPKEAIEYGKHSRGLPRYTFPKEKILS